MMTHDSRTQPQEQDRKLPRFERLAQYEDQAFFDQKRVREALKRLAAVDDLVIYCGAGVSIDLTGLSWDELIDRLYKRARGARMGDSDDASRDAILRSLKSNEQRASTIVGWYRRPDQSSNLFLTPYLREQLYGGNSWSTGRLLPNLADLCYSEAASGRSVTIVTTNYDDHIEVHLKKRFRELEEKFQGHADMVRFPRVETDFLDRRKTPPADRPAPPDADGAARADGSEWAPPSRAELPTVRIVYLHGYINRNSEQRGRIVLDERSYAKTRNRNRKALIQIFRNAKGLLVVGASLMDLPLIDALARTKPRGDNVRFCLIALNDEQRGLYSNRINPSPSSTGLPGFGTFMRLFDARASELHLHLLVTDGHYQTAQFVKELNYSVVMQHLPGGEKARVPIEERPYAERLDQWAGRFMNLWGIDAEATRFQRTGLRFHEYLLAQLDAIRAVLPDDVDTDSTEVLELEIWMRKIDLEKRAVTRRQLEFMASSLGPILDLKARRIASIFPSVKNASVQSFLEGRPKFHRITDLGFDPQSSQWNSFLSVPINVPDFDPGDGGSPLDTAALLSAIEDGRIGPSMPVGVVTLCSTIEDSVLGRISVQDQDGDYSREIRKIITMMHGVGLCLLSGVDYRAVTEYFATRESP